MPPWPFPACEHGHVDPTRGQKSFRTAWRNLTRAIECPACNRLQKPGKACTNTECRADISDIKSPLSGLLSPSLRSLKFLTKPLWPSLATSAKRCSLAIHTCGAKQDAKQLRRSLRNRRDNGSDAMKRQVTTQMTTQKIIQWRCRPRKLFRRW